MSINDVEIGEARATMVALATRMLDGELSYIEGTRAILAKLPEARVGNMDEFMAFIGIDSETDRFPFGAVRELWRQEALEQMQTDLDYPGPYPDERSDAYPPPRRMPRYRLGSRLKPPDRVQDGKSAGPLTPQ